MKKRKGSWKLQYFYFIGAVCLLLLGWTPKTVHAGVVDPNLGEISFEQPNGVTFKGELRGNEFLHYVIASQTSEVLIQESDSYWYYAKKNETDTALESTGKKYQIDQKPKGTLKEKDVHSLTIQPNEHDHQSRMKSEQGSLERDQNILVVMVEFSNRKLLASDTEPVSIPEWRNKFFGENPDDKTLKTYYKEATQDRINILPAQTSQFKEETGIVKVSLEEEHPSTNYQIKFPDPSYMEKALQKAEDYIDLSVYDKDHNGQITSNELHVLFVFAGFEITHANAKDKSIWAHKSFEVIASKKGLVFSEGYMATGELIHVERKPDTTGESGTVGGTYLKATPTTIGLFAHEFGHSLGLPDLYGSSNSIQGYGIGYHSTMSSGYWGKVGEHGSKNPRDFPGATPAHFDAYSKMKLGLATETITEEKEILMKSGDQADSKIYKLPVYKEGENTPSEKHYYLIENRKIYGFDEGRKDENSSEGISIYAVNEEYRDNLNILEYGKQIVTLKEANEGIKGYPPLSKEPGSGKDSYFKKGLNELFDFDTCPSNIIVKGEQPKFAVQVNDAPGDTIKVKFGKPSVLKGVFGTSQWTFDEKTRKLTFTEGTFPSTNVESTIKTEIESKFSGMEIKKIEFSQSVKAPNNMSYLFSNLSELTEIEGLDKLDVSEVTDMGYVFYKTPKLNQMDVSNWNTVNVTSMSNMFAHTPKVTQIDVAKWNIKKLTNLNGTFAHSGVQTLDLSNWDTTKGIQMKGMFEASTSLDTLVLGAKTIVSENDEAGLSDNKKFPYTGFWVGPNGENNPTSIKSTSDFLPDYDGTQPGTYTREKNTKRFGDIAWEWEEATQTVIFKGGASDTYNKLPDTTSWSDAIEGKIEKNLSGKKIKKIVFTQPIKASKSMNLMFSWLLELTEIEGLNKIDTTSVETMSSMFFETYQLKYLDVSEWDVRKAKNLGGVFSYSGIETLNLSNWETPRDASLEMMFYDSNSLDTLILGPKTRLKYKKGVDLVDKKEHPYTGRWVGPDGEKNPTVVYGSSSEFVNNYDGTKPGTYTREQETKKFGNVFWVWNGATQTITFRGGTSSTNNFLPSTSSSKKIQTEIESTLSGKKIKKIVFTQPVRASGSLDYLFSDLSELEEIEGLEKVDVSDTTSMQGTFSNSSQLTKFNVKNWNTSDVTNFRAIFNGLTKVETLDISGWNTRKMSDSYYMFGYMTALETIILGPDSVFNQRTGYLAMPTKKEEPYTGYWHCPNETEPPFEMTDLTNYDGSHPGAYTREKTFTKFSGIQWEWKEDTQTLIFKDGKKLGSTKKLNIKTNIESKLEGKKIKKIQFTKPIKANENLSYLFSDLSELEGIEGLEKIDTSDVTNFRDTFNGLTKVETLDISGWNTRKMSDSYYMFGYMTALETIILGPDSVFNQRTGYLAMPTKKEEPYTGYWHCPNETEPPFEMTDLTNYDGSHPGAYTREKTFTKFSGIQWEWKEDTQTLIFKDGKKLGSTKKLNIKTNIESKLEGKKIKKIQFTKPIKANENLSYLFSDLSELEGIEGLEKIDTSDVTNFRDTFNGLTKVETLDISGWNTRKMSDSYYMFGYMTALETIILGPDSVFNQRTGYLAMPTKKEEPYTGYWHCPNETEPPFEMTDLTNYDGSHPGAYTREKTFTKFSGIQWEWKEDTQTLIFKDGKKLGSTKKLNIKTNIESKLEGKKIKKIQFTKPIKANENLSYLFSDLSELEGIEGLEKIDTSDVTNFRDTFNGLTKVETLDISGWNTRKMSDSYYMFGYMTALETIILGPDSVFNQRTGYLAMPTKKEEPYTGYWHCPNETEPPFEMTDLTNYDGSHPGAYTREKTFTKFSGIQWEWKEDTQTLIFKDGKKLGSTKKLNIKTNIESKLEGKKIKKIQFTKPIKANENLSYLFSDLSELEGIEGLEKIDTSDVTNFRDTFNGLTKVETLDISGWNTRKMSDSYYMFGYMTALETIILGPDSVFNQRTGYLAMPTKKEEPYTGYWHCPNETEPPFEMTDLTNYDGSHPGAYTREKTFTKFSGIQWEWKEDTQTLIFKDGKKLGSTKKLNIKTNIESKLEGKKIKKIQFTKPIKANENLSYLFSDLSELEGIEGLEKIDTSDVTNFRDTFNGLTKVETLDISGWNTRKMSDSYYMFGYMTALETIILGPDSVFNQRTGYLAMPTKKEEPYTGYWHCPNETEPPFEMTDLTNYDGSHPGAYTREKTFTKFSGIQWEWKEDTQTLIFKDGKKLGSTKKLNIKTNIESKLEGKKIKKIQFTKPIKANENLSYLFSDLSELEGIEGLEKIDTSDVTNFRDTFNGLTKVETLDISGWNTRKMSDSYYMFGYMTALETIILGPDSVFNQRTGYLAMPTKKEEPYTGYWHCPNETEPPFEMTDLTNYDGSHPGAYTREKTFTKFSGIQWEWKEDTQTLIFKDGKKLGSTKKLNIKTNIESKLEGKKIKKIQFTKPIKANENLSYLFSDLSELEGIEGLEKIDTSDVTNFRDTFNGLTKVETLDISGWNTRKMSDSYYMFGYMTALETIILGPDSVFNQRTGYLAMPTKKEEPYTGYWHCPNETEPPFEMTDLTNYDGSHPGAYTREKTFTKFSGIQWEWKEDTQTLIFKDGKKLGSTKKLNIKTNIESKLEGKKIKKIQFTKPIKANENLSYLFSDLSELEGIEGLEKIDTSDVTNFRDTFNGLTKVETLDISGWNTRKMSDSYYMFGYMTALETIILGPDSVFNQRTGYLAMPTKKEEPYTGYWHCPNETGPPFEMTDLTNYDGSHPGAYTREKTFTKFSGIQWEWKEDTQTLIFKDGKKLGSTEKLNIKTNIEPKLEGKKIKKIQFTKPIKANENLSYLFSDLSELEGIEGLEKIDTSDVTNFRDTFNGLTKVETLDISGWNTRKMSDSYYMFGYMTALETIILGPDSVFNQRTGYLAMPTKKEEPYTGYWHCPNETGPPFEMTDLTNYDGSHPGAYTREKK